MSIQRSFYFSTKCLPYLHNCTQCIDSFSLLLQRHVRKGMDAKDPAILRIWIFLCNRKNPVKCNACVVGQKIAIECISPEAALHLVSTRNRDLWNVQHWKSAIQTHSARAQSQVRQIRKLDPIKGRDISCSLKGARPLATRMDCVRNSFLVTCLLHANCKESL